MSPSVEGAASSAQAHPLLKTGARLGYAASGVVHLLLGWLAVQLAWGSSPESADQTGALQELSRTAVGGVLLWFVVVGLACYGAYCFARTRYADV